MIHRLLPTVAVLAIMMSGCAPQARGPSDQEKWTARQIPAPKEPPAPPAIRPERIDPALQAAAHKELESALNSSDPLLRANAIEAFQNGEGVRAKAFFLAGLKSNDPPVRFASAMAIGQLRINEAADDLRRMINDSDELVGIGVRYALHRLGETQFTKDLQETARDPSRDVRGATAVALGMLGEPSAIRILKPMLRDPEDGVRIQAAEALWRLGQAEGLKSLVAASASGYGDLQCVALLGLAAPRDRRVLGHVRSGLTADFPEAQLVAARAAGMLGSDMGYAVATGFVRSADPRQRMLAAMALGAIGRADAQSMLSDLLKDKNAPVVRLAAAQAILQLQTSATAAGN